MLPTGNRHFGCKRLKRKHDALPEGDVMKKLLLSATALTLLAAPALAADMAVRQAPPMVAATVYNWTGFYTASSIGGAWYDVKGTYVEPPFGDRHNADVAAVDPGAMAATSASSINGPIG